MSGLGFWHTVIIGLECACRVLLLVAGLTYSTLSRTNVDGQWVACTYLVIEKLSHVQSQINSAETGERGFLLTDGVAPLDPYFLVLPSSRPRRAAPSLSFTINAGELNHAGSTEEKTHSGLRSNAATH